MVCAATLWAHAASVGAAVFGRGGSLGGYAFADFVAGETAVFAELLQGAQRGCAALGRVKTARGQKDLNALRLVAQKRAREASAQGDSVGQLERDICDKRVVRALGVGHYGKRLWKRVEPAIGEPSVEVELFELPEIRPAKPAVGVRLWRALTPPPDGDLEQARHGDGQVGVDGKLDLRGGRAAACQQGEGLKDQQSEQTTHGAHDDR